jgi:hypothetical protein
VRGALVALHVVAVLLLATPSTQPARSRAAWKDPTVQTEIRAWGARLRSAGLSWTDAELEARAYIAARQWSDLREQALRPLTPYREGVGVRQPWNMFVSPDRVPSRLHIELEYGDRRRLLYVARSDDFAWRRTFFDHDRVRAALFRFAWPHYERRWHAFARRMAQVALEEHPDATGVQAWFTRTATPPPGQAPGPSRRVAEVAFSREELR